MSENWGDKKFTGETAKEMILVGILVITALAVVMAFFGNRLGIH
jgi:hypothetical protein